MFPEFAAANQNISHPLQATKGGDKYALPHRNGKPDDLLSSTMTRQSTNFNAIAPPPPTFATKGDRNFQYKPAGFLSLRTIKSQRLLSSLARPAVTTVRSKNRKLLKVQYFWAARFCHRMSRMAWWTPALLSPQGGLSASSQQSRARCPLVSAVLARGVRAEIPLFFYATEIAAAKTLLIIRKPATMDILTKRGSADSGLTGRFIGRILVKPKSAHLFNSAPGST